MSPCPAGAVQYTVKKGDSLWRIARQYSTTVQAIAEINPDLDPTNLYIGQIICICPGRGASHAPTQPTLGISEEQDALSKYMRSLWEQHVYWTRLVILSMVFDLPDTEFVTNRLLRNSKDLEAALMPLYGQNIAAKAAELLTGHLAIAAELVKAVIDNNSTAAADAEKRWYANADQLAAFLGSINPYWSVQDWKKMLYDHLAMTKTEAADIITQKHEDSINIFNDIEQQALEMADMMTQGLVRQFPQYFKQTLDRKTNLLNAWMRQSKWFMEAKR